MFFIVETSLLAKNPALTNDFQQRIANNEHEKLILESLAENPSLTAVLMEKLIDNSNEKVRETLAKNCSLPEFLQARLIANNRGKDREILAGNPSLKIAQQAELANIGDIHVRLALFYNPSLDELVKMRIPAFTAYELNSMEASLERAEKRADTLTEEREKAHDKHYQYDESGLFGSEKKKAELERIYYRACNRASDAIDEVFDLREKVSRLKNILNLN